MSNFGENLKRIRESKNLTQQSLAEHLYVTRQAVSRWECGARYPDLITTKKISKILDVSIDELMRDEDLKNYEDIKKADKRKIITALFSIAVLFNIAYTLISTAILLSQFNFWQLKADVGFKIFQSAFNTAVLIFIFILHIRKKLEPKYIGISITLCFIAAILKNFLVFICYMDILITPLIPILKSVFFVINIKIFLLYFYNKIKSPIIVYIFILFNFLVLFSTYIQIFTLTNQGIIQFADNSKILICIVQAISILSVCSVYSLLFYQTYILSIERIITEKNK